ncbi:hypothetical protein [Nocardioides conyzicola]|uniref:hypothetical protein n=1 Tax=Nocardioides conyzicola TaxID=1651781 RepID=UPI0031E841ED
MASLVSAVMAALTTSAAALGSNEKNKPVHVGTTIGGLWAGVTEETNESATTAQTAVFAGHVDVGSGLFNGFCAGANWTVACDPEDVETPPALTPGIVASAFSRIPLPEAKLVIQPPNGRTLVNFETNFYTEQGEFTRAVTLLGQRVELRIWPASFGWRYGDGESERTTSPGAAYPDLKITHTYLEKGRVSPRVDATYAAEFRVGGGPWRDVAGTVTIPGTPQQLRVVEARPVLVGG